MENSLIVKLMLRVKHSLKLLQTIYFFSRTAHKWRERTEQRHL